jgi:hypothetical protein
MSKKYLILTASLLVTLLGTGCANPPGRGRVLTSVSSGAEGISSNSGSNGGGSSSGTITYDCPEQNNVHPDWDWMLDGTGHFRVCTQRGSQAGLKVHGMTRWSTQICVIPALSIGQSLNIFMNSSGVVHSCGFPDSNGYRPSFSGINYNSVFVVEQQFIQQMQYCLASANYGSCPSQNGSAYFSFGAIR